MTAVSSTRSVATDNLRYLRVWAMSKFKQTTLFGSLAKDQDEHIYKHSANTYEKFIEMWWRQARRKAASSKQETIKEAQVCNESMKI